MSTTRRFREIRGAAAAALILLLLPGTGPAQAEGKMSTGPAAAVGGGRPAGDPHGAVRALGSVQGTDSGHDSKAVTVPHLGGEGKDETRGVPLGTAR